MGFIAKFHCVGSGVDGRHGILRGTLVRTATIGLYYYIRIILAMTASPPEAPDGRTPSATRLAGMRLGNAVLAALVLLLIGLGACPTRPLTLIRATASMAARRPALAKISRFAVTYMFHV